MVAKVEWSECMGGRTDSSGMEGRESPLADVAALELSISWRTSCHWLRSCLPVDARHELLRGLASGGSLDVRLACRVDPGRLFEPNMVESFGVGFVSSLARVIARSLLLVPTL